MRKNGLNRNAAIIINETLNNLIDEIDTAMSEGYKPFGSIMTVGSTFAIVLCKENAQAGAVSKAGSTFQAPMTGMADLAADFIPALQPSAFSSFAAGPEAFNDNFDGNNDFAPAPLKVNNPKKTQPEGSAVGTCPHCGGRVVSNGKGTYQCEECGTKLYKYYGRVLTPQEASVVFSGQVAHLENLQFVDKQTGQIKNFSQNVSLAGINNGWFKLAKAV